MRRIALLLICQLLWAASALAVPETVSVRMADVTPTSFSVVWMTDVAAQPSVKVFSDASASRDITETVQVSPMPDLSSAVAEACRQKGNMKVRVSGLVPGQNYYVRTVTADPENPTSIGYSAPQEVTTAARVEVGSRGNDSALSPMANDLLTFSIFVHPGDQNAFPGMGELIVLESEDTPYPLSAVVGEGITAPEGRLDLNNLFNWNGKSLDLSGGEKVKLLIYRGGTFLTEVDLRKTFTTLDHFRRLPTDSGLVSVVEPEKGYFADINLDGKVDVDDFELFKRQYRNDAGDEAFNPDYNFIPQQQGQVVSSDVIDARDFARFATEYGNTDVE